MTSFGLIFRVLIKALVLFILLNVLVIVVNPFPLLNSLTLYGTVLPARERFPYSEDSTTSYSVTVNDLDAMFVSHEIASTAKQPDEFRVVLLGDSGVWGWLLESDQTLSSCINQGEYTTADGRLVRAYNLGYPALSVTKDVLILDKSLEYDVDAVVWLVTLQSLLDNEQLRHPITQENADTVRRLAAQYDLNLALDTLPDAPDLFDKTIIGRRRVLADWMRLQMYAFNWWMTGIDHSVTGFIGAPMWNLPDSEFILNRDGGSVGAFQPGELAWDVLKSGVEITSEHQTPLLVVDQPIFISQGQNSELRYNEYYPQWAFDLYRQQLTEQLETTPILDLWDQVPADQFTDTPFHYTAEATCNVAASIAPEILKLADQG